MNLKPWISNQKLEISRHLVLAQRGLLFLQYFGVLGAVRGFEMWSVSALGPTHPQRVEVVPPTVTGGEAQQIYHCSILSKHDIQINVGCKKKARDSSLGQQAFRLIDSISSMYLALFVFLKSALFPRTDKGYASIWLCDDFDDFEKMFLHSCQECLNMKLTLSEARQVSMLEIE